MVRTFRVRLRPELFLAAVGVLSIAVGAVVWPRPPAAALTAGQIQNLLPPGSTMHSLVRLDMDGRPPMETAVVAGIPHYPGAKQIIYYSLIFAYDRRHRQTRRTYSQPQPGPLPLSVDAAKLLGDRDAAIFAALNEDGTRSYRVVGSTGRSVTVLHEGRLSGTLVFADPLLIEDGQPRRTFAWDGQRFRGNAPPAVLPPKRQGITWRYAVRNGTLVVRTSLVRLYPRQTLRLAASGGGPIAIVVPDTRLDVLESGYRARTPGTYTIRILIPFLPINQAFTLTVVVGEDSSPK